MLEKIKNAIINGLDFNHLGEESYQKYSKFMGNVVPCDEEYDQKLNNIFFYINNKGLTDIVEIASLSNCNINECILKINYLKNKRLIDEELYVDTVNNKLLRCSVEEQKLLKKYKPFIYGSHVQVSEMITVLPNLTGVKYTDFDDVVYNEIKELYDKGLLPGIKLNDVDKKIIYYTLEKRKETREGLVTLHCPNCGALNDVEIGNKVKCSYCSTIIIGKY